MSKKPSFANLGSRLAPKPTPSQVDGSADTSDEAQASKRPDGEKVAGRAARQPDGRRGILVRARPEAWKALKLIALDGERTLQDVMTEAINDVLSKHGRPPVA